MVRPVTVSVPVDGLRIRSLRISERLSELFEGELVLESDGTASCLTVELHKLVGFEVGVTLLREDGSERYFHAVVASAVFDDDDCIRARLVPFAWLLTCSTDIRIFQNLTVPDIVTQVFQDYGFDGKLKKSLQGTYAQRIYCTQYRETDFNFVARLLEEEGIYFYFTHEQNKHTLVLADSLNAHQPATGCEELPLLSESLAKTGTRHVRVLNASKAVVPAMYTVRDYHFAKADQKFEAVKDAPREHGSSVGKHYDYPGQFGFRGPADGNKLAALRLEELQMPYETFRGLTECRGVTCGALLQIKGEPPRNVYNQQYLITGTAIAIQAGSYRSGGEAFAVEVAFEAISDKRPFRPACKTEKPIVHGLHTAVVVGKDMKAQNEDVHTDEYGRVLVQFHWDRLGKKDEKSSTWLRVSSQWAGPKRGWLSLPRVGDEVIVDFLEGDPDWPIVTGSVYNSGNKWPLELPNYKNLSGFFSRSTPGGDPPLNPPPKPPYKADTPPGDFNRLLFDDTKGEERIDIVARKDFVRLIWNDDHSWVGKDRQMQVDNNEKLEVKKDRERKVGENEKVEIGKLQDLKVGTDRSTKIEANDTLKIGRKLVIDVGDEIEIKTGMSKLVMKSDGTITLNGMDFKLKANMKIDLETLQYKMVASATAEMKASATFKVEGLMLDLKGGAMTKVAGGAMLDLKGGAMTMVKGGIILIN